MPKGQYAQPMRVTPKPISGMTQQERDEPWVLPTVRIGEPVLWYHESNLNATPHNAIVAAIEGVGENRMLVLDVMMAAGMTKKRSVRYYRDERAHSPNMRRWGCWKEVRTYLHEQVEALEIKVAEQNERIESLIATAESMQQTVLAMQGKLNRIQPKKPAQPPVAPEAQLPVEELGEPPVVQQ